MIYAGIGSRSANDSITIMAIIRSVAIFMANEGYTLRSGGAEGADTAFEQGCDSANGKKEIYLPWSQFNKNQSDLHYVSDTALELAETYHPAWHVLTPGAKKLMGRNAYQILGEDLDKPADLVICWTADGCNSTATRTQRTGGTGQAIHMASDRNIPIFNLANQNDVLRLKAFLKEQHASSSLLTDQQLS